jgi:hypothetical protein
MKLFSGMGGVEKIFIPGFSLCGREASSRVGVTAIETDQRVS